jgi:putative Ca2+/H+ antiporter (TMEM165/GDT1 family)
MSANMLEAGAISTGLVALAEVGDRTQLLGVMLACRFRRPWPVLGGILVASLANHLLAAGIGALAGHWLQGPWMKWVLGLSFIGFALWSLLPEKAAAEAEPRVPSKRSVFATTAIAFFLMEMADRTQIATAALAARFALIAPVVAGSTLGMMIVNTPSVLLGHMAGEGLPLRALKLGAAALSAAVGVWTLVAA